MAPFGGSEAKNDRAYNAWLVEKVNLERSVVAAREKSLRRRLELWPVIRQWYLGGDESPQRKAQCEQLEELFLSTNEEEVDSAHLWLHSEATTASGRRARPVPQAELEEMAQRAAEQMKVLRDYRAALRTLLARQMMLAMGQGRMRDYKGSFTADEIAKIRGWAQNGLAKSVIDLISDDELKAMVQTVHLASQAKAIEAMTEAEKGYLTAIGDGIHSLRRLKERSGVTRQAVQQSPDLKRLIVGGYVLDSPFETGLPADRLRLFHLSYEGAGLYRHVTGSEPYQSQCRKHWEQKENAGYDRRQGFWIDDLRAHAMILGLQAETGEPLTVLEIDHSVRLDMILSKDKDDFKALPVLVELGGKVWLHQREQVRTEVWKAAAEFGQVDVFVENEGLARTLAKSVKTPPSELKGLKLPGGAPVRFYALGALGRDYGRWPLEDGAVLEKILLDGQA